MEPNPGESPSSSVPDISIEMARTGAVAAKCPYCLAVLEGEQETCSGCRAAYHRECWVENGGCAVYGCTCVPAVESRRAIEIPNSFWGQENKPCPACGQQILAAAVRCRHCGSTFTSARPQDAAEFQRGSQLRDRLPEIKREAAIVFALSVFPFAAPVGAVWGYIFRKKHQAHFDELPPFTLALHRIGLIAAPVLTVVLIVMTVLYVAVRGR